MRQRHWVLLRHAHAEAKTVSGEDQDRPLSSRGQSEAIAAAAWLKTNIGERPVRIISSPATRAYQTASVVAQALGVNVESESQIYDATPGAVLATLNDLAGDEVTVLVGHNPGLEQTLALLTQGRSDEYRGMPTAGIGWFAVPAGLVEPGSAKLTAFWTP